jgi:short-chain fatty acids transporter
MIQRLARFFDRIFHRYTPDPYVIAVGLTFAVLLLAKTLTNVTLTQIVQHWGDGFWSIISFTLQMAMMLLGGYLIATSPPVQSALKSLGKRVRNPISAIVVTTFLSIFTSWINWGLGLVTGAFIALELARRVPRANFRLLVASAYSGFIVWHGGLSGSIPLLVNTTGNFSEKWIGGLIPVSQTIFSPFNIGALLCMLIILPSLNALIGSSENDPGLRPSKESPKGAMTANINGGTPAEKIDDSRIVVMFIAALGLGYLLLQVSQGTFSLDLNRMNFIFLFGGILLHGRPQSFLRAAEEAATKTGPILIQYPLYGGIMGIMTGSGLAVLISEGFVAISSAQTFPLFSFYSAGLLNLFIPSGGGQWAVQGPIVIPAAQSIGADIPRTIMAVAWGDAWTNLAQPFWALPLLAIAGLRARDIMGYCVMALIVSGLVLSILFLI